MLNGKATLIILIVGLIKRYSYIKWVIFQNPKQKQNKSWTRLV